MKSNWRICWGEWQWARTPSKGPMICTGVELPKVSKMFYTARSSLSKGSRMAPSSRSRKRLDTGRINELLEKGSNCNIWSICNDASRCWRFGIAVGSSLCKSFLNICKGCESLFGPREWLGWSCCWQRVQDSGTLSDEMMVKTMSFHNYHAVVGCRNWQTTSTLLFSSCIPLLPAHASEQGNAIGSVSVYVYIYIYIYVIKKKL